MPTLNDVLAVIMGGGRGTRLYPLTQMRSKPAVPIAGKYRLIDITLSNCINSGLYRVAVLTQFNSVSLHRHITQTYNFDVFHTGWVQILAAEQTMESADWYQGTADAVRKQLFEIKATRADYVLILAGDHLYRMDYAALAEYHWQTGAEVTVAVQPVTREEAPRFGILKRAPDGHITAFTEKPKDPQVWDEFASSNDPDRPLLGSMGIYVFNTEVLIDLLTNYPDYDDFGGDVIPHAIDHHQAVFGYNFDDYWADIGTMDSFYKTNLELTKPDPPFNFYYPDRPIYTHARFLPGSIVEDSLLKEVLLAEGCRIQDAEISHSVVGVRSQIYAGAKLKDSILMGADYYSIDDHLSKIPIGIGPECHVEGAILDKNVRLGKGVVIKPFPAGIDLDHKNWYVRDGIVIIPKDTELAADTHITPKDL
jgi:glucose-1-phosphate adenylyltransferase